MKERVRAERILIEKSKRGRRGSFQAHLNLVSRLEGRENWKNAVRYLNGFVNLLENHKKQTVSDKAYQLVKIKAEYLIRQWR